MVKSKSISTLNEIWMSFKCMTGDVKDDLVYSLNFNIKVVQMLILCPLLPLVTGE